MGSMNDEICGFQETALTSIASFWLIDRVDATADGYSGSITNSIQSQSMLGDSTTEMPS